LLAELAGQGERLCEECPSLQLRRRRAVLDAAINRVRVVARGSPSHRFQPARFKITWRL
jgi:hypothetical protein